MTETRPPEWAELDKIRDEYIAAKTVEAYDLADKHYFDQPIELRRAWLADQRESWK